MSGYVVSGKKVLLRQVEESDLEALRAGLNDSAVRGGLNKAVPVAAWQHASWIKRIKQTGDQIVLAAVSKDTGATLGAVSFRDIDSWSRRANISVYICSEADRSKHIGREMVELAAEYGFGYLNLQRIGLLVADGNDRALKCYHSTGFVEEGRLRRFFFFAGEYRDAICLSRLSDEACGAGNDSEQ